MDTLPVQTLIGPENRSGGLLLCGANHGYSKEDERRDAAGINRADTHKSFFSDADVNNYPFRRNIVTWFSLWGYQLARSGDKAGAFERSIVQTNWLQTCSSNTDDINTQWACIEDHESFLLTCQTLKPKVIFFFGRELLWAFTSPTLGEKVESIFGSRVGKTQWIQKDVVFNGKARRRFRFGFQQYENLCVVALPHATAAQGVAHDYIEAFKPEMSEVIDAWWAQHEKELALHP